MNLLSIAQLRTEINKIQCAESPLPFSILFWTANRKDGTGGDGIELEGCMLMKNQFGRPKKDKPNKPLSPEHKRDANHHINDTFNIVHLESQNKFKVHFDLITKFQGKTVIPNIYE